MNTKYSGSLICLLLFFGLAAPAQDVGSLISSAEASYMNADYEKALDSFTEILSMSGTDSTTKSIAYAYAGLCSEELGENENALGYYREAIIYEIPRLDIYDKFINLAKEVKNDSLYEFGLQQKLAAFPDFEIQIVQSLAYQYYNKKQYGKLLDATAELTEWFPDNPKFHFFHAIAAQNTGDLEAARTSFQKSLELDPDHPGANMGMGMLLYNEATDLFMKAIKEYESIKNPTRIDYAVYNRNIKEPQAIYRKALPYLLKAYESGSYSSLKGAIYNSYMRLEEMENAEKYKK